MKAVSQAHKNRSLQEFESALNTYREELGNDQIIRTHLAALYDTLLEQNLQRVIEPYSHVEISKVAKLVNLPSDQVETKLSQMILDHSLNGILDQGKGCLIIFEEKTIDESYELSLNTLKNMGQVVESLYQKVIINFIQFTFKILILI
jgi:26S proteasome regulatory subunit N6